MSYVLASLLLVNVTLLPEYFVTNVTPSKWLDNSPAVLYVNSLIDEPYILVFESTVIVAFLLITVSVISSLSVFPNVSSTLIVKLYVPNLFKLTFSHPIIDFVTSELKSCFTIALSNIDCLTSLSLLYTVASWSLSPTLIVKFLFGSNL